MKSNKIGSTEVNGLMYLREYNNSEFDKSESELWLSRLRLSYDIGESIVRFDYIKKGSVLMEKLPLETVRKKLVKTNGWDIVDDKWLHKKYRFKSFLDSIKFVNEIAKLSEKENHHPFIAIDYVLVTLKLTSWREKGITELDIKLIKNYDDIYEAMI